jgi:hypothetical protein
VLEFKLEGFKMGRTRLKLAPKELPIFSKESKLGLEVLSKKTNRTKLVQTHQTWYPPIIDH